MALYELSDSEVELLNFVLGTTIEQWDDEYDGQVDFMTKDPSVTSAEQLLELVGSFRDIHTMIKQIRSKLIAGPILEPL
jgi:hypothetical protein